MRNAQKYVSENSTTNDSRASDKCESPGNTATQMFDRNSYRFTEFQKEFEKIDARVDVMLLNDERWRI